ncbi:alkaline phosphatase family protein [Kribbella sp. NPDC051770]|uniref:alkaline phosphatase family protein n=1 Tax=Kribbella sp. NPDC051770 TaxID=3155413 RepID=UPI00341B514C
MNDSSDATAGISRRRLIGGGAAAAGMAAASLALPPNVRAALAQPAPKHGGLKDIKHVVMLMQENRSFDQYYGTLNGVRGFDDPHAARLPNGRNVFFQPDPSNPDGYLLPFRLNTKFTAAQAIPSTSHEWAVQHQALNGGRNDNWVPAHRAADGEVNGQYTMGYYTREDLPFQFALAEAFTLLDGYHCSVLGPTAPNRHMWMSGTIDPNGLAGGPSLTTGGPANQFSWKTYPERLQEAGVSWKIYRQPGGQTGATFVAGKIDAIAANPEVWAKTVFILSYDENDGYFDHVVPKTPKPGTPDEFVHKTSNTGVDGGGLPIGLGFRVPCIIVSPWTTGGYVFSETSDHTSQLRFLEHITGVKETNISRWRRETVGDLTGAFRFGDSKKHAPTLPDTTGQYNLAQYQAAQLPLPPLPGSNQKVPHQEKGHRPHIG